VPCLSKILPHDLLRNHIYCYWTIEGPKSLQSFSHGIIPDGGHELVIDYGQQERSKFPSSLLISQLRKFQTVSTDGEIGLFIIIFRPYGLNILTPYPVGDFANQLTPAIDISKPLQDFSHQLLEAPTNAERVKIADRFFLNNLSNRHLTQLDFPIESVINRLIALKGKVDIKQLADRYHASISKFERHFKSLVGVSPKKYSQIVRFRTALDLYLKDQNWADFIYKLGYYDQAHFINEFKQYTGKSPQQYLKNQKSWLEEEMLNQGN
jgi:AraC-like DNA-binding protein